MNDEAAPWVCGGFRLSRRPLLMGIVNVTPDSFYDGGRYDDPGRAVEHARRLIDEGADLIDVGGESTRPGARAQPAAEQLRRVLPVLEALAGGPVPLSVDTSDPVVMRGALAAGASVVNDVRALAAEGALEAVAASGCGVVLMHMQGTPETMQRTPSYADPAAEVRAFLAAAVQRAEAAGIGAERIAVDPGFGFGKTVDHNWQLLARLCDAVPASYPIVVGVSRKSMLGALSGRPVDARALESVVAAVLAVTRGARILRVHDVADTRRGLAVLAALTAANPADPLRTDTEHLS